MFQIVHNKNIKNEETNYEKINRIIFIINWKSMLCYVACNYVDVDINNSASRTAY